MHFDPPADEKDYVHRSGRTGRAGAEGVVVTFVAPELRKDVTRMQKILKMTAGITSPDASPLPIIERPARRAHRPARSYQTVNETMPGSKRRAARPAGGTSRSARPTSRRGGPSAAPQARSAKPAGAPARSAKPAGPLRQADAGGKPGGGATPQDPGGNRKTRRAHLQPGESPAGSGRKAKAAAPNRDKGKRRQPSGGRG